MEYFPPALEKMVEQFARLPGIGHKTAQRLAFFVLSLPEGEVETFAQSILEAKRTIALCPVCQNLTQGEGPCPICASEKRDDKRPMLSDLRESGAIEQDADEVLFLYRDDYYNENSEEKNVAECIIAKNRHGETGTVKLQWLPQYTTFSDLEWKHEG